MTARRRRFQLDLRDAGERDDVDVIHRLRSLLKAILRGWHIRCTRAVELPGEEPSTGQDGQQREDANGRP